MKRWDDQSADERAETIRRAKRRGARLSGHPAWGQMLAAARKLGLPRAFAADLYVHDVDALARLRGASVPFLWAVGESGSYFSRLPEQGPATSKGDWLARYLSEERPHVFYWDGIILRALDAAGIRNVIAGRAFDAIT